MPVPVSVVKEEQAAKEVSRPAGPKTIVDRKTLELSISHVANVGAAASFGERQPGAASVAAPLLGNDGHAVGAVSACGPVDRFDEAAVERLLPLVRSAAHEVSSRIGRHGEGGI